MPESVSLAITAPERLWSRSEVLARPCPVPATSGIYGWFFKDLHFESDISRCARIDDLALLYLGISPKPPPANGYPAPSM